MKRFIIIQLLAVVFAAQIQAQGDGEIKYRRSSLYSMMINHEGREFGDEIKDVFLKIPVPDKYNNHDLSVKVIYTSEKKLDKNHEEIDEFIRNNGIASRMVGRWFNRDYMTGVCDVELVKERGLYNASELDKALAIYRKQDSTFKQRIKKAAMYFSPKDAETLIRLATYGIVQLELIVRPTPIPEKPYYLCY